MKKIGLLLSLGLSLVLSGQVTKIQLSQLKEAATAGSVIVSGPSGVWTASTIPTATYAPGITPALTGTGTVNNLAKYLSATTLTPGIISDNGTRIGINTGSITPLSTLEIKENDGSGFNTLTLNSVTGPPQLTYANNGISSGFSRVYSDGRKEDYYTRYMSHNSMGNLMLDVNAFGNKEVNVLFKLGVSNGTGAFNPGATIHGVGNDATSSNYTMKFENSAGMPLLWGRNDGFLFSGNGSIDTYFYQSGLGGQFIIAGENGFHRLQIVPTNNKFFLSNGGSGGNSFTQINTSNGNWLLGSPGTNVYSASLTDTKLTAMSSGSTSSTYNSKFLNSVNRNLLSIQDNGWLSGDGDSNGNPFMLGNTNGYIYSQGIFQIGSVDFASNFGLHIYGNSDVRYWWHHVNGSSAHLDYYGSGYINLGNSSVTTNAMLHPDYIRIGINSSYTNIESSAALQVNSTTQGILPSRMTAIEAEAISAPAEGLLIYSTNGAGAIITTKGWWGWSGSTWEKLNN